MKRLLTILGISGAMLVMAAPSHAANKTMHWALLLELPSSVSTQRGETKRVPTARLAVQLEQAGYDKDRIYHVSRVPAASPVKAMIEAMETIASKMVQIEPDGTVIDNVLLVFIAGRGLQLEGIDMLQVGEITKDQWADLPADAAQLWRLSDVLKQLARIPSQRQCVVIDGASTGDAVPETRTRNFGTEALQVREGQCLLLNKAPALNDTAIITAFSQGVLHALGGHADANNNDGVSLLEFSEYMTLYANAKDILKPTTFGQTAEVFEVSRGRFDDFDDIRQSKALRDVLATRLLQAARTALLLEGDLNATESSAKGAAEYAKSPAIKDEATMLLLTVKTARGKFKDAWKEAQDRKLPLLAYAVQPTPIEAEGKKLGTVQRGEFIDITEISPGGDWALASRVLTIKLSPDKIESRKTNGWIDVEKLSVELKQSPPLPDVLRPVLQAR